MRAIALIIALVCFCSMLGSMLAVFGGLMPLLHGVVLAVVNAGLVGWWLAVADKH